MMTTRADNLARQIFFLDDEPAVCMAVEETLRDASLAVRCFLHPVECLAQLPSGTCDLLIADLRLPEMDGLEVLRRAKRISPRLPVLIVTGYGDIPTAVAAIQAGAEDFIEKPLRKRELVAKVKSILAERLSAAAGASKTLTPAEMLVLDLIMDGKQTRQIAEQLNRSVRTIETHRASIKRKLGVKNLVELIKRIGEVSAGQFNQQQEAGDSAQPQVPNP
jgi:FixJ family two-component response regulator